MRALTPSWGPTLRPHLSITLITSECHHWGLGLQCEFVGGHTFHPQQAWGTEWTLQKRWPVPFLGVKLCLDLKFLKLGIPGSTEGKLPLSPPHTHGVQAPGEWRLILQEGGQLTVSS